jgi:hypothetical protein
MDTTDIIVNTVTDIIVNTANDTIVNTVSDTFVNTATDTFVNTATDTVANTATDTVVNTSTDTIVNTTTDTVVNTITDNKVQDCIDFYLFSCPHCDILITVMKKELNCKIFRCGQIISNGQPIPPHASKIICDNLKATNMINGCGKPFILKNTHVEICGYI